MAHWRHYLFVGSRTPYSSCWSDQDQTYIFLIDEENDYGNLPKEAFKRNEGV